MDLKDNKEEVKSKIKSLNGKLMIKYFPPKGVSVKKLQQHIDKMIATDNKSDVIIVDCMQIYFYHIPINQIQHTQNKVVFISLLRGMSGELGIPIWMTISNQPFYQIQK